MLDLPQTQGEMRRGTAQLPAMLKEGPAVRRLYNSSAMVGSGDHYRCTFGRPAAYSIPKHWYVFEETYILW